MHSGPMNINKNSFIVQTKTQNGNIINGDDEKIYQSA